MTTPDPETASLDLLRDLQHELKQALKSKGDQKYQDEEGYLLYTAAHINKLADGYLVLRQTGRVDAAKQLIRPTIEAAFHLQAVRIRPELLFRIAYSEYKDDLKWITPIPHADTPTAIAVLNQQWLDFAASYRAKYPTHATPEQKFSAYDAAEAASLKGYYDTHYRLYCRFAHAAFRATFGTLSETDHADTPSMNVCTFAALETLRSLNASVPNLVALTARMPH